MKVKKLCWLCLFMGILATQTACQSSEPKISNPSEKLPLALETDVVPAAAPNEAIKSVSFEINGLIKKVKKE